MANSRWTSFWPTAERVAAWLFFAVALALLPFVIEAIQASNRSEDYSLGHLLANGELFIINAAVAAAALGEVFTSPAKAGFRRMAKLVVGFLCVAFLVVSALWYADTSLQVRAEPSKAVSVATPSVIMFVATVLASVGAVILGSIATERDTPAGPSGAEEPVPAVLQITEFEEEQLR